MPNKINIRKIWISSFDLMVRRPIVLLPFIIIAFFEGLALELVYFSTRKPISLIADPIIRKFSGEAFLHYPFNLTKLPEYFYDLQILIYVLIGVFLMAISVNIVKNIRQELPLKTNALINNASRKYLSFVLWGIIVVVLTFLLVKADEFIFSKIIPLLSKQFPQISQVSYSLGSIIFIFLTNIILQTFLVLVLPILVIRKASLLKAMAGGIALGARYFFKVFLLIFLPFLVYFPVTLLKTTSVDLGNKFFPEIILYISIIGIIASALVECFILVCASQFLLEKDKV